MQEVQTVSAAWIVVIGLMQACLQALALWIILRGHRQQWMMHIEAMAALVISMQPPNVREHCRRVASISETLAMEMGFSGKRIVHVRSAGLLHEVAEVADISSRRDMDSEIVAVADYFDNVTHNHTDLTQDEAIEQIRQRAGKPFHPAVVKALMAVCNVSLSP